MSFTPAVSDGNLLQPSTRAELVSLVKDHAILLVRESLSVSRHCKRARVVCSQQQSENDSSSGVVKIRRRLHAADINMALQLMGSEKLYATSVVSPSDLILSAKQNTDDTDDPADAGGGGASGTSASTRRVQLAEFLQHHSAVPRPPSDVGVHLHWLAVNGVQPEIPQNPSPAPLVVSSRGGVEEEHDQLFHHDALQANGYDDNDVNNLLQVDQLQSSLLSEELQLYFTRVTMAMERGHNNNSSNSGDIRRQQDAVLLSLSRDTGLQELVPFLVRYCQQQLYKSIGGTSSANSTAASTEHGRTLVRLASALLHNRNIHLELSLHELLPALMTCVVAKRISSTSTSSSSSASANSNHWALRREAAAVLVQACQRFGHEYTTLQARVLRTLCDALSPERTLAARYGGIVVIATFGAKAVDAFLLPTYALECWREWEGMLETAAAATSSSSLHNNTASVDVFSIQMCQRAILDAIGIFLRHGSLEEKAGRLDWQDLEDAFADRCVVFQDDSFPYAACLI